MKENSAAINRELIDNLLNYLEKLTTREYEVATLLSENKTSKEIAEHLCISPHTVDSHRRSILRKLKIKDTSVLSFIKFK